MAQQVRRTAVRHRPGGARSGWRPLLIGFVLGLVIMWAVQHIMNGGRLTGLRKLFAHHPVAMAPAQPPAAASAPPKPTFDFYTILPEVGSGMPEAARRNGTGGSAGAKSPGKGVRYILQAAAYAKSHDADHLRARLALEGIESYTEKVSVEGRGSYYRVRLGPFASIAAMNSVDRRLARLGIKAIPLKVKAAPGA